MASITNINYIQIPFRCTQTVDKSLTKAIWIIYIILSQEQHTACSPYQVWDSYDFKFIFKLKGGGQIAVIGHRVKTNSAE